MKIPAEVVGIGQKMDLDTSKVTHTLELRLSDGSTLSVNAEERDVEKLIQLSVGLSPQVDFPSATPEPSVVLPPGGDIFLTPEGDVQVFGGEPQQREEVVTRAPRTVPTDEMGNPIVPRSPRRAEPTPPPPSEVDDDGVPPL